MEKKLIIVLIFLQIFVVRAAFFSPSVRSDVVVEVDADPPMIKIFNPMAVNYHSQTLILVNYSIVEQSLDSVWYSINEGFNKTIFSYFFLNLSEGNYVLSIYANDSFGRVSFSKVNFSVNNSISWCGNGFCDFKEDCSLCQIDCGICKSVESGGGSSGGVSKGSFVYSGEKKNASENNVEINKKKSKRDGGIFKEGEKSEELKRKNNVKSYSNRIVRFSVLFFMGFFGTFLILIIFIYLNRKGRKWKKKRKK